MQPNDNAKPLSFAEIEKALKEKKARRNPGTSREPNALAPNQQFVVKSNSQINFIPKTPQETIAIKKNAELNKEPVITPSLDSKPTEKINKSIDQYLTTEVAVPRKEPTIPSENAINQTGLTQRTVETNNTIPKVAEISELVKEFEAGSDSNIEKIESTPKSEKDGETSKMVKFIMKASGGVINEQRKAEYVLLGIVVVVIMFSLLLVLRVRGNGDGYIQKNVSPSEFIPGYIPK